MHLVTLVRSFRSCDVDVDPITLVYDLVLDIPNMYMYKKNKFPRSRLSKVRARTVQTDTQTDANEGRRKAVSTKPSPAFHFRKFANQ